MNDWLPVAIGLLTVAALVAIAQAHHAWVPTAVATVFALLAFIATGIPLQRLGFTPIQINPVLSLGFWIAAVVCACAAYLGNVIRINQRRHAARLLFNDGEGLIPPKLNE